MSVVTITKMNDDTGSVTGTEQTEQWNYVVEFSDFTGTAAQAMAASGIPWIGSIHPTVGKMLVTSMDARRVEDAPEFYAVSVSYSTKNQEQEESKPDNPASGVKWNIEIDMGAERVTETVYKDRNANPIQNKAGQCFDPTVEKEYYLDRINLTYNTDAVPAAVDTHRGMVNDAQVVFNIGGINKTYAARELKLTDSSYKKVYQDGDEFWAVTLVFLAKKGNGGWTNHIRNQGFCEKINGQLIRIKDKFGDNVSEPVDLDANGARLADGQNPIYLDFEIEEQADFDALFAGLS